MVGPLLLTGDQVAPPGSCHVAAAGVPQSPWVIEQSVQTTGSWVWSHFDLSLAKVFPYFCIQCVLRESGGERVPHSPKSWRAFSCSSTASDWLEWHLRHLSPLPHSPLRGPAVTGGWRVW